MIPNYPIYHLNCIIHILKALKEEFQEHFKNITRVMDCVTCDKCKLWGKLQVTRSIINKVVELCDFKVPSK